MDDIGGTKAERGKRQLSESGENPTMADSGSRSRSYWQLRKNLPQIAYGSRRDLRGRTHKGNVKTKREG